MQNGTLELQANTGVAGNISIAAGSLVNSGNITTSVGGNWTNSGTFNPGNGTVLFNGTGSQALTATTFANLVVTKSGGAATLTGNAVINGDLAVNAGSLDIGAFAASRSSAGGSFTLGAGASLLTGGAANFPANYALYNLATTSTVNYNGTVAQSVAGIAYGNLIFSNGGANAKTLTAPATVNGDLTINSGATFDAGANSVALGGNWVNNGSFVPAASTLLLNGSAKTITGNTTFNRITVYGSYTVNGSDITYNGLLNVTATGSYNAGAGTATVNGDLTNSGSLTSTGITTFTGTTVQTIRFINAVVSNSAGVINFNGNVSPVLNSTSTPTYANLNINNTAGINPSVDWLVLVSFTIGSGAIFNGGTHTHTIRGNFTNNGTVTSSGTLLFNPPVAVNINLGNAFSSTGLVTFQGTGAITLSGNPSFLQDLDIENSNAAGITPPGGWTINGDLTVNSNAIFNAGSNSYTVAGDIESNGTLNGGTSTFTMNSAAGLISGSPGTTFHHFTVAGSITANSNFQVDGNFTNNGVFDASLGELVMTGNTPATIGGTTNPSNIAQLTVNKSYTVPVTLARNIANITNLHITEGVLDAGSFTLSEDAVNNGELTIEDSATLKIGGTNTLPVFTAYTLDTLSTVDYAGSTQTIAANVNYGNLTVSTAGIKTPGAALTIVHDFTLSNGTFAGGAFTHLLGGDWNMTSGTFTNTGTTIQLNGVDSQFIASTGAFNNLTLNKTAGLAALAGNITVNNTLGFTAGKLWLAANNLTMGTTAAITGVNAARYVIADSTGSLVQPVSNGGNKSFPVGTAAQYIPAVIALTAGSVTDNFSVSVLNNAWNNGTSGTPVTMGAVKATWLINEALAGGSNATITLQWPSVLELPGFNRSAGRLAHYISGNWNYGPGDLAAAGTDPYTITRGGFTSFSPFAVSSFQALPVTWVSLSGKNLGSDNQLSWVTANETDNAYFAVEFSADGNSWAEAGRVPGANNASTEQHYSFLHRAVPYTTAWYRIKQVDINGRYSYSRIIRLARDQQEGHGFIYVTNPATNKVTALIGSDRTYQATLIMVDAAGRVLQKKSIGLAAGSNSIDFNVQGYVPGIYFLQYLDESGNRKVSKFVKQ